MDNKQTLQSHNNRLIQNNNDLTEVLDMINNMPEPEPNVQAKSIEITENGTITVTPDADYDGLSSVEITTNAVEVLTEELTTQNEELTEQETSIDTIISALNGKKAGSADLSITINEYANISNGDLKDITISGTIIPYACFFRNSDSSDGVMSTVEKVTIAKGVTEIKGRAFWNANKLTTLILNEGLERIRNGCFYACTQLNLKTLPKSVKNITQAFRACKKITQLSMPNVEIVDGSDSLGWATFSECTGLKAVWIGSKVTSDGLGVYTFGGCTNMKKIFIDLPRSVVTSFANYWCTWSCTQIPSYGTYTLNNSVVVCNDDEGWMTQEEFDAIDWSTYTG